MEQPNPMPHMPDTVEKMMLSIEQAIHDERTEGRFDRKRAVAQRKFYKILCKSKQENDQTWWKLFDAAFVRAVSKVSDTS
jgi:hypothetical protein